MIDFFHAVSCLNLWLAISFFTRSMRFVHCGVLVNYLSRNTQIHTYLMSVLVEFADLHDTDAPAMAYGLTTGL